MVVFIVLISHDSIKNYFEMLVLEAGMAAAFGNSLTVSVVNYISRRGKVSDVCVKIEMIVREVSIEIYLAIR